MATDQDRDELPVKGPAVNAKCNRFEPHIIAQFNRNELEDKYIRLYEESNDLKKVVADQNVKIKRLGAKLVRVLDERKHENQCHPIKLNTSSDEEIKRRLLELERENYILKDKNTVLKQQLASHSRQHMAVHRSPIHVNRVTNSQFSRPRQSINNGDSYAPVNPEHSVEMQLRDAEAHIVSLNEEVKILQNQTETLQRELEQCATISQKAQVDENIELIKLRRQKKQLESQLRVAEHCKKVLELDVARLQKENEDALHIIAEKQNAIIDVQGKLDKALKFQLECQELQGAITDLTAERNILKQRCDDLYGARTEVLEESKALIELKKEIEALRQELTYLKSESLKNSQKIKSPLAKTSTGTQTEVELFETGHQSQYHPYNILDRFASAATIALERQIDPDSICLGSGKRTPRGSYGPELADKEQDFPFAQTQKIKVENEKLLEEVSMLKDLIQGQKNIIQSKETQIIRLRQEMALRNERYRDVFQQRDLFIRLLENTNKKTKPTLIQTPDRAASETYTKSSPVRKNVVKSPRAGAVTDISEKRSGKVEESSASTQLPPTPKPRTASAKSSSEQQNTELSFYNPAPERYVENRQKESEGFDVHAKKVVVEILWLQLEEGCRILADENVKALYVDFTILGRTSEDFETPDALPKPLPGSRAEFNFTAEVTWDEELRRKLKTIKEKNVEDNVVVLHVVSEPPDDGKNGDVECLVVGVSYVSFQQFAECEDELLLPVCEASKGGKFFGTLAVKLNAPPAIFQHLC